MVRQLKPVLSQLAHDLHDCSLPVGISWGTNYKYSQCSRRCPLRPPPNNTYLPVGRFERYNRQKARAINMRNTKYCRKVPPSPTTTRWACRRPRPSHELISDLSEISRQTFEPRAPPQGRDLAAGQTGGVVTNVARRRRRDHNFTCTQASQRPRRRSIHGDYWTLMSNSSFMGEYRCRLGGDTGVTSVNAVRTTARSGSVNGHIQSALWSFCYISTMEVVASPLAGTAAR